MTRILRTAGVLLACAATPAALSGHPLALAAAFGSGLAFVMVATRRQPVPRHTPADLDQAALTVANTKDFLHVLPAREAHRVIAGRVLAAVDHARQHRALTSANTTRQEF